MQERQAKQEIASIDPESAYKAGEIDAMIVDVREAHELERNGRVPGALHAPMDRLAAMAGGTGEADARLAGAKREGRRILTLCGRGGRARRAAETLSGMGYDARVIEGGMEGWRAAGLPVER